MAAAWGSNPNEWTSGTGQKLYVHLENDDCKNGCAIHNPTLEPHPDWPQHWRSDTQVMERICPHGVGHPDLDHLNYLIRTGKAVEAGWQSIHGCDGCCGAPLEDKVPFVSISVS